jgi:16S rRNA (cytosine967-C5)-methyltransferase
LKENTKIHGLLVEAVAQALSDIYSSGRNADKVIEFYLKKNRKWGSRDRKFIAESVYEVVRWWRYLWWLKGEKEPSTLDLSSLKSVWAHWWAWKKNERVEPFLSTSEFQKIKERMNQTPSPEILFSIPDWMFERGKMELGEEKWIPTLQALNAPAPVYLRTNTLKTTAEALILRMQEEGVDARLVNQADGESKSKTSETLILPERKNIFTTKAFKLGLFEVQDWASQQVALMLEVEPGMRVIDACAGAGGKTLHIAALMKNKGKIIALDIHEWKLKELRTRSTRGGVDIIDVKLLEGQKTVKRLESSADRLLLDVPCSGMGVLRRNPDAKWKLSNEEILRLSELQKEILFSYSKMLKAGGRLVYSTCSILPSENEKQVSHFLENNPEFSLIKQKTYLPQDHNSDGFYMAFIERKSIK